jgi:hypothetical protein
MAAVAVARIQVAAIGRDQGLVELALLGGQADIDGVVGVADLELLDACGGGFEQFGERRYRAVMQIWRGRPDSLHHAGFVRTLRGGRCGGGG